MRLDGQQDVNPYLLSVKKDLLTELNHVGVDIFDRPGNDMSALQEAVERLDQRYIKEGSMGKFDAQRRDDQLMLLSDYIEEYGSQGQTYYNLIKQFGTRKELTNND